MNVVMMVPTGLGCEIGGHAGDANPVAKLIASCCDNFITHPNVVNASDINEMPENTWYVEGSMLTNFLLGGTNLKRPNYNKILIMVNKPVTSTVINAVSAARVTIGANVDIAEIETPLSMEAKFDKDGAASGNINGIDQLVKQIINIYSNYDAIGIVTKIDIDPEVAKQYLTNTGGVNPWGGVEAMLSKDVSAKVNKPVVHAPFGDTLKEFNEIVDPRMAPEMVSMAYMHCIIKGLHRAPLKAGASSYGPNTLHIDDIDAMVSPGWCYGPGHSGCENHNIPIIVVEENKPAVATGEIAPDHYTTAPIIVNNYLEAAGVLQAMRAGVTPESVRRPINKTRVFKKYS